MRAVAFPTRPGLDGSRSPTPEISVVVITRDRPEWLRRCLASLASQTNRACEVIVVDSSEEDESETVAAAFEGVRYLRFPAGRRGMPAARNAGVRVAQGDVVAFLDDDCEPSPGWLAELAAAYRDPTVDGVGGKVVDPVVTLGRTRRFLTSGEPWAEPDDGDLRPADVDFLQGGNMSFRREVLLVAGGFDTGYTGSNFREETDLCFRLRANGCRLRYVPEAQVAHGRAAHINGIARSPDDARREFYHARNQTYFVLKNYGICARALAFYLGRETALRVLAVVRRPGARTLAWLAAHVAGKVAGILAGIRFRLRQWPAKTAGGER